MKRINIIILLTLLISMMGIHANAHSIEVKNNGKTIYYSWINNNTELAVSFRGTGASAYPSEYSGDLVIPAFVTYNNKTYPVTRISDDAFEACPNLTSVKIPNSVTYIGNDAFYNCSGLTSVNIPNYVTHIGSQAFAGCKITSIDIPPSVTFIGNLAFSGCSRLTSLTIPSSVTTINSNLCSWCSSLTTVVIPNSVTSIGSTPFSSCSSLTSIIVEWETPINLSSALFNSNSSTPTLYVPEGCVSAYLNANFWNQCAHIEEIHPVHIGSFWYNLKGTTAEIASSINAENNGDIVIPASVTYDNVTYIVNKIGDGAFQNCANITSVTIPGSVTAIGNNAFSGCSGLTTVRVEGDTPPIIGSNTFPNCANIPLYVPAGCREAYKAANYWNAFVNIFEIPLSITMATSSGSPRTMKGFSSANGLDFTNVSKVKAYIAVGFTASKDVLMARVKIVPPYTGVVLLTTTPGITVDVPVTLEDVYYVNMLKQAVESVLINPVETIDGVDYTNLLIGTDSNTGELGFITFDASVTRSNNCYLQVPTSFYESATTSRQGLGMVFVDSESTDIQPLMQNGITTDVIYDLQGRKLTSTKKGLYIRNGKKFYVK